MVKGFYAMKGAPMRVLAVTSDITLSRSLDMLLRSAGAICEHADCGEEALDLLRHYDYDIVVLDSQASDMDAYEVIRRMRSARLATPVIALSAASRPEARVKALSAGADDVIPKPFDRAELVARLQAVVRRSKGWAAPTLQIGALELNLDSKRVFVSRSPVHLTGKEYAILELLVLRKGMVLTKEAFLNHLYGGIDEPEMKIIDVFICKLRKKLALAGAADVIGTVWGRGYTLRDSPPGSTPVDLVHHTSLRDFPLTTVAA
jgi:two-component system cell cycle response regulator CtrA